MRTALKIAVARCESIEQVEFDVRNYAKGAYAVSMVALKDC